jgi:hypothetical protein
VQAFNCSAWARNGKTRPCSRFQWNDARAIHHRPILLIEISTCAGRACYKKNDEKQTNTSSLWNARRTVSSFARGTSSQKHLLFGDDNHKRCAMHSPFLLERPTRRSSQRDHLWWQKLIITKCAQDNNFVCSRDQLAESAPVRRWLSQTMRNAFSFLLERSTRMSSQRDHMCSDIFCSYLHRHTPRRSRDHTRLACSAARTNLVLLFMSTIKLFVSE